MKSHIGKICPYCKTEIKEGDAVKVCPACDIPHHESCWEENGGCTTFGCSGQRYEVQGTNPTDVCKNCGAELGDGQAFCPKCGTPKGGTENNFCSNCGTKLQDGQQFCPNCGQKVGLAVDARVSNAISQYNAGVVSKKKKAKALPIVIGLAAIAVIAVGLVISNLVGAMKPEEAIAAYKESAAEFCSIVLSDATLLENIGNAEIGYWRDYINDNRYGSIEMAVLVAQIDNADAISAVEGNYDRITMAYKELLKLPKGAGSELEAIKDAVEEVYAAYADFYDTVMNVKGTYSTFSAIFLDADDEVFSAIKKLGKLVL